MYFDTLVRELKDNTHIQKSTLFHKVITKWCIFYLFIKKHKIAGLVLRKPQACGPELMSSPVLLYKNTVASVGIVTNSDLGLNKCSNQIIAETSRSQDQLVGRSTTLWVMIVSTAVVGCIEYIKCSDKVIMVAVGPSYTNIKKPQWNPNQKFDMSSSLISKWSVL